MITAKRVLEGHGLRVFDVEELKSHGGSLRVYACRAENHTYAIKVSVKQLVAEEDTGIACVKGYENYGRQVKEAKLALLDFVLTAAHQEKTIAGYGAPGKSRLPHLRVPPENSEGRIHCEAARIPKSLFVDKYPSFVRIRLRFAYSGEIISWLLGIANAQSCSDNVYEQSECIKEEIKNSGTLCS